MSSPWFFLVVINHPPVITIFLGGMEIPFPVRVVYGFCSTHIIVLIKSQFVPLFSHVFSPWFTNIDLGNHPVDVNGHLTCGHEFSSVRTTMNSPWFSPVVPVFPSNLNPGLMGVPFMYHIVTIWRVPPLKKKTWFISSELEHGPVEIGDLPMKNGDFPVRYVTNYQGVKPWHRCRPRNVHHSEAVRAHWATCFSMGKTMGKSRKLPGKVKVLVGRTMESPGKSRNIPWNMKEF